MKFKLKKVVCLLCTIIVLVTAFSIPVSANSSAEPIFVMENGTKIMHIQDIESLNAFTESMYHGYDKALSIYFNWRNIFQGWGIHLYTGKFGAGKTSLMVCEAYKLCEKYPQLHILTNIKLQNFPEYTQILPLNTAQDILNAPKNTLVLIDEIGTIFNSRDFSGGRNSVPKSLYQHLCQCRKRRKENNCIHKLIKPKTPRHNGKVERSHRKDNEWFYATHKFYSFEDYSQQLKRWQYEYNNIPTAALDWNTPQNVYNDYVKFGEVYEFNYNNRKKV